jgi:penicillin-binding protein 1A
LIPLPGAFAGSDRTSIEIMGLRSAHTDECVSEQTRHVAGTPLQRYATTALGASEVTLLELATAYRAIASGVLAQPYVIRQIVRDSGEIVGEHEHHSRPISLADGALPLIQEGLRGVVRIPAGTAHALDSRGFPIAVMGKTGTTNEFRDALFVGSTYGVDGITTAVRIGFDDNRSLGPKETGGRVALPVFQELMLSVYRDKIAGPLPSFPPQMEERITRYLQGDAPALVVDEATSVAAAVASRGHASPAQSDWLLAVRGESPASHRGRRGAPLTRRDD